MSDYSEVGYNQYLERPIVESTKQSTQDFDRLIDEFAWDKGRGGQLNLGGSNNNDGILYVRDKSGKKKLTIDNDGIHFVGSRVIGEGQPINIYHITTALLAHFSTEDIKTGQVDYYAIPFPQS